VAEATALTPIEIVPPQRSPPLEHGSSSSPWQPPRSKPGVLPKATVLIRPFDNLHVLGYLSFAASSEPAVRHAITRHSCGGGTLPGGPQSSRTSAETAPMAATSPTEAHAMRRRGRPPRVEARVHANLGSPTPVSPPQPGIRTQLTSRSPCGSGPERSCLVASVSVAAATLQQPSACRSLNPASRSRRA
jgi:hypothetical protein